MPKDIVRSEVQPLIDAGAQLVEVLPKDEYDDEHIVGAISIPLRRLDREAPERLGIARPVIVYCWDSA